MIHSWFMDTMYILERDDRVCFCFSSRCWFLVPTIVTASLDGVIEINVPHMHLWEIVFEKHCLRNVLVPWDN